LLELRCETLAARVEPAASMVCASLTADGEELLGQRDGLDAYVERGKTMGIPLLHPWANRLFGWEYGEVKLERDAPGVRDDGEGHPIHGLVHGRGRFEVLESSETGVRAELDFGAGAGGPGLLRSFPFPHVLEVAIELAPDGLVHRTTLRNTGVVPCPVAFGWHPYFNAPERLDPVDEPSDLRSYDVGRVRIALGDGYDVAHRFVPPSGDLVAFEPMTAPIDALRTGTGLRHVAPGATFSATFAIAVQEKT
jgi:galactose mutarotase-like enzyme